MLRSKKVYIAAPYTNGNQDQNVLEAMYIGAELLEEGFIPYIPHLCHFWHMIYEQTYEKWLEVGFEWLKSCDVVLRLPGESKGADKEVELAKELKIPVYYSMRDLCQQIKNSNKQ